MLNGYEREFVYAYGAVSPCEGELDWKLCPQHHCMALDNYTHLESKLE